MCEGLSQIVEPWHTATLLVQQSDKSQGKNGVAWKKSKYRTPLSMFAAHQYQCFPKFLFDFLNQKREVR